MRSEEEIKAEIKRMESEVATTLPAEYLIANRARKWALKWALAEEE